MTRKERVAVAEGRREALRVEEEKSSISILFHSHFIAGEALDCQQYFFKLLFLWSPYYVLGIFQYFTSFNSPSSSFSFFFKPYLLSKRI